MDRSVTAKQVELRMWVKTQRELLEEAVRNQSLERYVVEGSRSLLFAAIFCLESGTPLENVELPTQLQERFDEEETRLEVIASGARSLPREKRIRVMERASQRPKSSAKTEYRTIEECKTIHEAGTYLSFFETLFFPSHPTERNPQFEEILHLETSIWEYWIIYDACLKLAKSPTEVTGSNVLDRCIRAFDLFKRRITLIGVCKDVGAPKKSEMNLERWTASLFMEQAEEETEHVLQEASPNDLREASVTREQSKEFEERASSSCSVRRLPTSESKALDSLSFNVEEYSDPRQPSQIAKRFHDLFKCSHVIGESLASAGKGSSQKFISKFILNMLNAVHSAAALTLERKGKLLASALGLGDHPGAQRAIIESAVSLCRVMPDSLTSKIYKNVKMRTIEFQNWRKSVDVVPTCIHTTADAFIEKCIPLFWDMCMQRRPLVLVADHTKFCPSQHERFSEFDESSQIDFFLWPCLIEEVTRRVLAKGKVVTKAKEQAKAEDVAESLQDFDSPKHDSDSSEDMTDSENHVLEAHASAEVEEISDSRRPREISKRFQDLFDDSDNVRESLDSAFVKSSQKFLSKFILDMLNAVYRAAMLTLEEKGKLLADALDLESHVDSPSVQRAIIESAALLCRVMPASLTSQIYELVKTRAMGFQNWRKCDNLMPPSIYTSANTFLEKCIPVFWDIVIQRRSLVLVTEHKMFCPSQHERYFESDESSQIDYFVWPCLLEKATGDVLAKGRVVTKEKAERESVADLEKCILAAFLTKNEEEIINNCQRLERQTREIERLKAAAEDKDLEIEMGKRANQDLLVRYETKVDSLREMTILIETKEKEIADLLDCCEAKKVKLDEMFEVKREKELELKELFARYKRKEVELEKVTKVNEQKEQEFKKLIDRYEMTQVELKKMIEIRERREQEFKDLVDRYETKEVELKEMAQMKEQREREFKELFDRYEAKDAELKKMTEMKEEKEQEFMESSKCFEETNARSSQ
ncbi:uncharacterized protein [Oscarella lobularis]|uniref:uncharacterized protein isoform X3 n=1 Tax=Oscarella lobularis TaxID=121494 RepID=UPI003313258B